MHWCRYSISKSECYHDENIIKCKNKSIFTLYNCTETRYTGIVITNIGLSDPNHIFITRIKKSCPSESGKK